MLHSTITLPAGGASAYAPPVNSLEVASLNGRFFLWAEPPALTTTQLPDGETITYTLLEGNDAAFGTTISSTVIGTQTGAGGVGAAKAIFAGRPKLIGGQYITMQASTSAGAAASGVKVPQHVAAG